MTKSLTFSLDGYHDPIMGGIAFGEISCVLLSGPAPTTPADWRKGFASYGHANDPEATYAHAIAAGVLVPKGNEMHLAPKVKKHFDDFKKLSAA